MRATRLTLLFLLTSLAGCSTQTPLPTPPPSAVQPPSAPGASFTQTGLASFYGRAHDGKTTANGDSFNLEGFTAAHRTLPFGTRVRVTNLENGRTVTVTITDRGPYVRGRIVDISLAAARALDMQDKGVTRVRLDALRPRLPTS